MKRILESQLWDGFWFEIAPNDSTDTRHSNPEINQLFRASEFAKQFNDLHFISLANFVRLSFDENFYSTKKMFNNVRNLIALLSKNITAGKLDSKLDGVWECRKLFANLSWTSFSIKSCSYKKKLQLSFNLLYSLIAFWLLRIFESQSFCRRLHSFASFTPYNVSKRWQFVNTSADSFRVANLNERRHSSKAGKLEDAARCRQSNTISHKLETRCFDFRCARTVAWNFLENFRSERWKFEDDLTRTAGER